MSKFTYVEPDSVSALPPARSNNRLAERMDEYETAVKNCPVNGVITIPVAEGESSRGEALRISRAATRCGVPLETWTAIVGGVATVYGKRLPGTIAEMKAAAEAAKAARAAKKAQKEPKPIKAKAS